MVEESSTEKSSAETEEEKATGDSREVVLDRMVDEDFYAQFSPEVSIYSTSESEEELPELLAKQSREVELVYGQEDSTEMACEVEVEEELGCAPTVQLDFVPEEGAEETSVQDLCREASQDID